MTDLKKASFVLKFQLGGCRHESSGKFPNPAAPCPPTAAMVLRSAVSQIALAAELAGFGDEIAQEVAATIQRVRAAA